MSLLHRFSSFLRPGLLRLPFLCVAPLSCLGLALSPGSLFSMGPCVLRRVPRRAHHGRQNQTHQGKATPGTMLSTQLDTARQEKSHAHSVAGCHVAVMLAPTRRTLAYLSFLNGTDPELHGCRRFGARCGGSMEKGHRLDRVTVIWSTFVTTRIQTLWTVD